MFCSLLLCYSRNGIEKSSLELKKLMFIILEPEDILVLENVEVYSYDYDYAKYSN